MKKLPLIILATLSIGLYSCSNSNNDSSNDTIIAIEPTDVLSQQEVDDLLFLREEEKLARDVYLFSYDLHGATVFTNIASSEQQHMDQVLGLINIYGLTDPAATQRGVFNNTVLQGLYNDLTAQSSISLVEALKVGALIEDLDINDIDTFESTTDNATILNVYESLICGSRNHIRSYSNQLSLNGIEYVTQFISQETYSEIIDSPNERCGRN